MIRHTYFYLFYFILFYFILKKRLQYSYTHPFRDVYDEPHPEARVAIHFALTANYFFFFAIKGTRIQYRSTKYFEASDVDISRTIYYSFKFNLDNVAA